MRIHFLFTMILLLTSACPAPRRSSDEWLALQYSKALLQSDVEFMQSYVAQGLQIEDASRDPNTAALHVIRLCPQGEGKADRKNALVLFGGKLRGPVYGIDMLLIKEEVGWRVRDARISKSAKGRLMLYLRNCNLDMSPERISIQSDLPLSVAEPPSGIEGGEQGPAF